MQETGLLIIMIRTCWIWISHKIWKKKKKCLWLVNCQVFPHPPFAPCYCACVCASFCSSSSCAFAWALPCASCACAHQCKDWAWLNHHWDNLKRWQTVKSTCARYTIWIWLHKLPLPLPLDVIICICTRPMNPNPNSPPPPPPTHTHCVKLLCFHISYYINKLYTYIRD